MSEINQACPVGRSAAKRSAHDGASSSLQVVSASVMLQAIADLNGVGDDDEHESG